MTPEQIAKKYVHGAHDALTDRQEIKDMVTDIETYVKEYHQGEVLKKNIHNVRKCQHPYKKVVSGDDGMWCTECNKYITTF